MKDIFRTAGMVHPKEYDWVKQFLQSKKDYEELLYPPYMSFDVGKVLGLAQYCWELEQRLGEGGE